jgi:peptidoglycan/LPS O-acetylase OafA/YrhL
MTAVGTPLQAEDGRIAGLDGVRALAVLLVMTVHLYLVGCGWIGVQLFFVLSGFLITRILLVAKDKSGGAGRYFGQFYLRRSLRIFPAYYAYLLVVFGVAMLRHAANEGRLAAMAPYLLSYTYNYGLLLAEPLRSNWTSHLWSLSVEEQFYIVWPLLIWLTPRRAILPLAGAIVAAGPLLRLGVFLWARTLEHPQIPPQNIVYVFTSSHIDAFATGAALCFPAVAQRVAGLPKHWFLAAIAAAIAVGVVWSGAFILPPTPHDAPLALGFPVILYSKGQWIWGYTAINLLGAVLIAKVALQGFGKRLFQSRLMDRLGRVSYGAYLFHYVMVSWFYPLTPWLVAHAGLPTILATLLWTPLYVGCVYALSWLSFHFYETPFLKLKDRLGPRAPAPLAAPSELRS